MNKNQLILPVSILLASFILGGFYYVTQREKKGNDRQEFVEKEVESKPISEEEQKEQSLVDFDKKVSDAIVNKDYETLYEASNRITKKYITKNKFIEIKQEQNKQNTGKLIKIIAEDTLVEDDEGVVSSTYFTCLYPQFERYRIDGKVLTYDEVTKWIKENSDDSRAEEVSIRLEKNKESPMCEEDELLKSTQKVRYSYINNVWQMYEVEPSERALNVSGYFYNNISKEVQKEMVNTFGEGSDNYLLAIRNVAVVLDSAPEALADLEVDIEKDKSEKNRPIVNVENPIQQPQSSWRDYMPSNNKINCTTNTVGGYTYTNCY